MRSVNLWSWTLKSVVLELCSRIGEKRLLGENPFLEDGEAVINPDEVVEYNFERMAIKDIPSAQTRAMLGYGHLPEPGRDVIANPNGEPWAYRPENCLRADETRWTWITVGGEEFLVCPGCGVDGT